MLSVWFLLSFLVLLHRGHVVLENIWAEAPLLDLGVALTVALMAIGLEIARLEIGRTSVIVVGTEAI